MKIVPNLKLHDQYYHAWHKSRMQRSIAGQYILLLTQKYTIVAGNTYKILYIVCSAECKGMYIVFTCIVYIANMQIVQQRKG